MKKTLTLLFLLPFTKILAQSQVEQVINAEKSFAEMSKTQGAKKAFLTYIDNECVGYHNGKEVNVYDEWEKRRADSSALYWQPEFAVASASGDMGITTGPWQYYTNAASDTAAAHGQFASVWQKNEAGEWKVTADVGISYNQDAAVVKSVKKIALPKQDFRITYESEMEKVNDVFADALINDKNDALNKFADDDCYILIDGHAPLRGSKAIKAGDSIIPSNILLKQSGNLYSRVKDLLACYGKASAGEKKWAISPYGNGRVITGNCFCLY